MGVKRQLQNTEETILFILSPPLRSVIKRELNYLSQKPQSSSYFPFYLESLLWKHKSE